MMSMKKRRMEEVLFYLIVLVAGVIVGFLGMAAYDAASGTTGPIITVDGVEYEATGVTPGGTIHFETPDTNPQVAFTERHTWTGNGSEHLPCEGGIHWIDNKNVLTVSHCLEVDTTTTTVVPPTTTTSVVESTTTTESSGTTTTLPPSSTTTTEPSSTTTEPNPATTSTTTGASTSTTSSPPVAPSERPELPFTGVSDLLLPAGLMLLLLGGLALDRARHMREDDDA